MVWGVRGTGSAGSSASGLHRRPTCLCRPVRPPAPGARPPLTLQNDLLERLPLQPVPAPQLLRDVALPAGEVGRAETRRHGARGPGASAPPIRAGTGGRGPQHEATRGRGKAGSPTLTSTSRPPPAPSGMVFRLLSEIVWARTGRPASSPTSYATRTHVVCADAVALVNDTLPWPEALRGERRPLGGVGASCWLSPGWKGDRKEAASARLPTFPLPLTLFYILLLGLPPFSSSP